MNLDEEKNRELYKYSLDLRKLMIDKLAIGLVIAVLGCLGNAALERYRQASAAEQFLLEEKLSALKQIRSAYAEMFDAFDTHTVETSRGPADGDRQFQAAVDRYARASVEFGTLLSHEFILQMDYHLWVYCAFRGANAEQARRYRPFIYALYHTFQAQSQSEMGLAPSRKVPFAFEAWPHEKADTLGAAAFLEANFRKWDRDGRRY
jgi:hypothetical protein